MLVLPVLVLIDASLIDANVSKTSFYDPVVVMVALYAKTSDVVIPIFYFHDFTLTTWLSFNFIFLCNF